MEASEEPKVVHLGEEDAWIALYALRVAERNLGSENEYEPRELAGVARTVERQLAEAQGRA